MPRLSLILILTLAFSATAAIPQPQDEDFAQSVKQWTTGPEFISPLVDHLPKAPGIPSPKDVLGYHIGTPKKLTHTADIYKYYRALAAASKRVRVFGAGQTDEGRECIVIAISSEENIANLNREKDDLAKLADPRRINEQQAKEIVARAKPIYMFTAGLHSAETGPPEMLMELAYRLVAEDSPLFDQIRRNTVVMMAPVFEPDGRDRYVDWYYKNKLTEESESDRIPGPPYWGKYIFHDNNRDINYSQITMRNWLKFYLDWHPPIMHELHESVPFLYTFSGQAPQNPTLDPILYAELPWFSNFEMTKMIGYGMPGVWTHGYVDMWSPGYLGFMSSNHNGMLRMYETFGNGGANTMKRRVGAPEGGAPGATPQTTREWYRPLPPYKEVVWSMRNNTNYMETGVISALELASSFPQVILENFYHKSRNSLESGKKDAPFGYVIPANQPDMTRVAFIVNHLRMQGIEVGRAESEVKLKEGTFPAGSLIVKRDQPYGRLAKILLEKQDFPDANLRTYDDTGWTMGLMNQAEVKEVADKSVLAVPIKPVDTMTVTGAVTGEGRLMAVLDNGANSLMTLRYRLKDTKFEAIEQKAQAGGLDLPAGTFLVASDPQVKNQIEQLGLKAVALSIAPDVPKHLVDLPRLAVFSTWGATQDVGWVRHAFDQFEVGYDLIYKERVRKGNLRKSYDVILIPNQGRGGSKAIVNDIEARKSAIPYKDMYGETEDITGGMGIAGVNELDKFVNEGGVLITLGVASFVPADFGITRDIDATRTTPAFYAPGPIVEAEVMQSSNPIFYGYSKKVLPVRYANGPLLRVPAEDRKWILMQYVGTEQSVLSGLMKGAAETKGRPAIVDVPVGKGRVLMFATNPCYRWQNLGEFGMLFNSILHFNDMQK
ncbi:MAG: hypothetical protein JWO80_2426 [Bryobacterales bacterium]|nr:hypothetical protein [Bryobacterales bacterium]